MIQLGFQHSRKTERTKDRERWFGVFLERQKMSLQWLPICQQYHADGNREYSSTQQATSWWYPAGGLIVLLPLEFHLCGISKFLVNCRQTRESLLEVAFRQEWCWADCDVSVLGLPSSCISRTGILKKKSNSTLTAKGESSEERTIDGTSRLLGHISCSGGVRKLNKTKQNGGKLCSLCQIFQIMIVVFAYMLGFTFHFLYWVLHGSPVGR